MMEKLPIAYTMPAEDSALAYVAEEPVAWVAMPQPYSMGSFQALSRVLGFSQAEWAQLLHISLRTLQRYLKEGTPFEGLHAELLVHLQRLTDVGLTLFASPAAWVAWLRTPKAVLGYTLGFSALGSISGIRLLRHELGRMAEGVYV